MKFQLYINIIDEELLDSIYLNYKFFKSFEDVTEFVKDITRIELDKAKYCDTNDLYTIEKKDEGLEYVFGLSIVPNNHIPFGHNDELF